MKRIYLFFIVLILPILLSSCVYVINKTLDYLYDKKYTDWQNVIISGVGSFKVPWDWIVVHKENVVLITNKAIEEDDYKIYLIGAIREYHDYDEADYEIVKVTTNKSGGTDIQYQLKSNIREEETRKWYSNFYDYGIFDNVELLNSTLIAVYSNSAYYIVEKFKINGEDEEKHVLHFSNYRQNIILFAWDNLIEKDAIVKIAKSYKRE